MIAKAPQAAPEELRLIPRWVNWIFKGEGDGRTKVPCNSRGFPIDAHDPANQTDFDSAVRYATNNPRLAGVGFVFVAGDDILGIDFDYCFDPSTGEPHPWAAELINRLGSRTYGERSPSGLGIKFFGRGKLPADCPHKITTLDGDELGGKSKIELYEGVRFFTVTGNRESSAECVANVQPLLDEIVKRGRRIATQQSPRTNATTEPRDIDSATLFRRASNYVAKMPPSISGSDGHKDLFKATIVLVHGFALDDGDVFSILFNEFSPRCSPPWSEREINHKIRQAHKHVGKCTKPVGWLRDAEQPQYSDGGYSFSQADFTDSDEAANAFGFSNVGLPLGDLGQDEPVPLTMAEVTASLKSRTGDYPRRTGGALFVPDGRGGIDWLRTPAALFAWIGSSIGRVDWRRGAAAVTKEEFFAEQCRTATAYDAVEFLKHIPPLPGHYYVDAPSKGGDGRTLTKLLDRFAPATEIDRQLINAMFATLLWGGVGGSRPVFVITSDKGRGAGKSTAAKVLGLVAGGMMDFSQNESVETIKSRLLSPDGLSCRVALFDNLKSHRLSWAEFEAIVTAPTISGKRMYVGEAKRPNTLTWVVTLNGASLSTDVAQRSVIIKLASPQRSADWEEVTTALVVEHRDELLGDLAAFYAIEPAPPAKFTRWAAWEAAILSRLPDPNEAQRVIVERQGEADVERDEMETIEDYFADRLTAAGYDTESEAVHVPAQVAARWWNEATNDKKSPTSVTRIVTQLHGEGCLKRLKVNPSRAYGRGLIWLSANGFPSVAYDLNDRMRTYSERF